MPTPVVHTRLRAPASRMGPADDVDAAAKASPLLAKYGTRLDPQSAKELLAAAHRGAGADRRTSPAEPREDEAAVHAQEHARRRATRSPTCSGRARSRRRSSAASSIS